MTCRTALLGTVFCAAASFALPAQPPAQSGTHSPMGYHSVACVKANAGKSTEFRGWITGDEHKYAQSRVDSGAIYGWLVLRAIIPQGEDARCDYALVTFYRGAPNPPMNPDDVTAALHKAGLSMTAKELSDRRDSLAHLVYTEMLFTLTRVGKADKGGYVVLNSMSVPNMNEWLDFEQKVWQPVAQELMKEGVQSGWALNTPVFPGGAKDMNLASTVDMYPTWESVFKNSGIAETWKKVHPDTDGQTSMERAQKLRTIDHRALYQVEDLVMAAN